MFTGSIVALVTPMHDDGRIDWDALAQLIEWHIAEGTDAIVTVGTTGESATLDPAEHQEVMRFTFEHVNGGIPVIAGAGGNSTAEAIKLAQAAQDIGCAATLQVVPYYNKPPQRGLIAHYRAIAEAVALPHLLYNVPSRTGCDLRPETVVELAKIDNIVGIKEASSMARMEELRARVPRGFAVLCGEDGISAAALVKGTIDGVVSVTANIVPRQMHDMVAAGLAGERAKCEEINAYLAPLHEAMFFESNPLPVKWALHKMGKIGAGIRLPLLPLAENERVRLEEILQTAALL